MSAADHRIARIEGGAHLRTIHTALFWPLRLAASVTGEGLIEGAPSIN